MTEIADALEHFRMALHAPIDLQGIASHVDGLVTLLTPPTSGPRHFSGDERRRVILMDLIIHVERWRAVNDVQSESQVFEDNAIEALDLLDRRRYKQRGDAVNNLKQDMLDDMRMAIVLAKEAAPHGHVPLIAPFFTEIRHIRSNDLGVYTDIRREVLNDVGEAIHEP